MNRSLYFSAALLMAAPALAQDTSQGPSQPATTQETAAAPITPAADQPAAVAPAPQCELHVWPAERFQAMTTGLLGGGLIDAAMHANGDKARRSRLASALDGEGQVDALQKLDLVSLLRLPPSRIVAHTEALDRKTINKIIARRSDSTASCYAELMVTDVFYQKSAFWGRTLRTSFMLRQFNGNAPQPRIKKTMGGNGLKIFPAKEGEDATAADAELVTVFQKNFTEAAQNFAKQTGS